MDRVEELTRNFYAWEVRGRGWQSFPHSVGLEPPFRPFPGHLIRKPAVPVDDGRRETTLSALVRRFLGGSPPAKPELPDEEVDEPEPEAFGDAFPLVEIGLSVPEGMRVPSAASEALLRSFAACRFPISFEILGTGEGVRLGIALRAADRERVQGQLRAFFPEAVLLGEATGLREAWRSARGRAVAVEFGLGREFMLPLRSFREFSPDPLTSIVGTLADVGEGEAGVLQVLFSPARSPWAESILRAVHDNRGEPFFLDAPELTALSREKVAHPLFAAALRVGARGGQKDRAWEIVRGLAAALGEFGRADGNELVPLSEGDADLEADLLARTSHRTGMLLSSPELASFVHLPHESLRAARLRRESRRTKAPPPAAGGPGVVLGMNAHEGQRRAVRLSRDLRMRHMHVIGASGTGKSTFLVQLALQDIESGEGVGILDPHGDLVDEILSRIPEERMGDVILFDPSDEEAGLGWNMLEARSEAEKTLLASDLVGVFRRLSTSWGDQMNSVLANGILAFLESDKGGTLLELRRFLVDREFRAEFLRTIRDPEILFYWQKEFPLLVGKPQGPILTRLDTFLRPKLVRRVVVELENRLDFRRIVDEGKIFLAKLSQGAIGEENAALLGSLLVSTFHRVAMSRQDLAPSARRHFFLSVDEFQHFATPSMAALLTGARKYRLGLTLAHQELRQLDGRDREVASALLGNAATRIVFRVGEEDARALERGFSYFASADLQNLEVGEAVARIERADHDFNLATADLPPVGAAEAIARRERIVALMRERFPKRAQVREQSVPPEPSPLIRPRVEERPSPPRHAEESPPPEPRTRKREPRPAEPPPPMGRGGPEHQYLQELVKRWGEAKGYHVVIEEPTPDGKGSVDVVLRRGGSRLACEISVTSTVEQEVGNVLKCLAAGFPRVVLLSMKKTRLARVRAALTENLPPEDVSRVLFFAPEELSLYLDAEGAPPPSEESVGGYRVKVDYEAPDESARASRAKAIADLIARRMNEKKRGKR